MFAAPQRAIGTLGTARRVPTKKGKATANSGAPPFSCSDSGRPSGSRSFHARLTAQRRPAM
ncbi:hypothetical protein A8E81_23180 [Burkholderia cenocepacia]|nr:hypothetical protein A8E75_19355 [Burkholderia cenocepacia]ONV17197.1 hypothetical protein A8E74_25980 [Burkholderia cenocepacia]ONV21003.1 hypothetical protein A8E78_33725 [Burkholderia cenocepacia]ONV23415.1 hypothetical protein A8E77_31000 [Burkholderia cenocepacia]ONV45519.1 hypothetical protein A8E82_07145 [Burkholderia cenocepacia]